MLRLKGNSLTFASLGCFSVMLNCLSKPKKKNPLTVRLILSSQKTNKLVLVTVLKMRWKLFKLLELAPSKSLPWLN